MMFAEIKRNLIDLYKNIKKKCNNKEDIKENENFTKWLLRKLYIINVKKNPTYVNQLGIYFCELGYNIGAEISGKRPVVIMQNNKNNNRLKTTIIIPITSYQNSLIIQHKEGNYICFEDENKNVIGGKKLSNSEIPIQTENNVVVGVAKLTQIRTISKKRLDSRQEDKMTKECFEDIKKSINKIFN